MRGDAEPINSHLIIFIFLLCITVLRLGLKRISLLWYAVAQKLLFVCVRSYLKKFCMLLEREARKLCFCLIAFPLLIHYEMYKYFEWYFLTKSVAAQCTVQCVCKYKPSFFSLVAVVHRERGSTKLHSQTLNSSVGLGPYLGTCCVIDD